MCICQGFREFCIECSLIPIFKNHRHSHLHVGPEGLSGRPGRWEWLGAVGTLGALAGGVTSSPGVLVSHFLRRVRVMMNVLRPFSCRTFSLSKHSNAQRRNLDQRQRLRCKWGLTAGLLSPLGPTPSRAPGPAQTPAQGRAMSGVGTLRLAVIKAPVSVVIFRKCLIHVSKYFKRRKAHFSQLAIQLLRM